jgi:hypothetical protein
MLIPFHDLDPSSKVWIFQAEQELTESQATAIKELLFEFLEEWTAHNVQLYTSGDVLHHRFIVIMVDERFQGASGCSLDKMTHFIQYMEHKFGITLLERTTVAYESSTSGEIATAPLNQLGDMSKNGIIQPETIVFNNLVKTKAEFEQAWRTKIKDSWHKRFI